MVLGSSGSRPQDKGPSSLTSPPTLSVYCKHATAEVTGRGLGRLCGGGGCWVPAGDGEREREVEGSLVGSHLSVGAALAHQTAPTDGYI